MIIILIMMSRRPFPLLQFACGHQSGRDDRHPGRFIQDEWLDEWLDDTVDRISRYGSCVHRRVPPTCLSAMDGYPLRDNIYRLKLAAVPLTHDGGALRLLVLFRHGERQR